MNVFQRHARTPLILGSVAAIGLLTNSCAGTPDASPAMAAPAGTLAAYPASTLDDPPKLLSCSKSIGPPPSAVSGTAWERVSVRYVVGMSGRVDATSINVTRTSGPRGQGSASQRSMDEARQLALSCRYEPGRKDHVPVPSIVNRTFRISVGD